jgi:hypothetical protein
MKEHYDRLGLSPGATPDQIKAAYHAKLREFPAHSHPQEFKAIRASYEAVRKGDVGASEDFFQIRPVEATLEPEVLRQLRERIRQKIEVRLEDLIRETF